MGTVNMDGFRPATTAATAVKDRIGILTGRLFKRPETIDPTDPIHNLIRQIGGSAYMCIKHWKRVGDEPRIFIEVPERGFFGDRHPYQRGWVIASDGGCFGLTEDFRIVAGSNDVVCGVLRGTMRFEEFARGLGAERLHRLLDRLRACRDS